VDRWRAIGASITGSGHKSSAIPCQDAHLISSTSDELLIIAVADGAGSAKYADRASQLCVKNAVEAIYPSLGENKLGEHELACLLRGAFRSVRESLINEANVNTSGKAKVVVAVQLVGAEGRLTSNKDRGWERTISTSKLRPSSRDVSMPRLTHRDWYGALPYSKFRVYFKSKFGVALGFVVGGR
jgi:serine/threonine protein phosphatase PrpC